jgi:hypothetical protein
MLLNSGHSSDTWCYCAETAADIYRFTLHTAINKSPYEAWYGIKPSISHLRVWGCIVYVKVPSPKKSEDRVIRGYFMGFTKSRLLIRWLDPTTRQVKHAYAVQFDEHCTPLSLDDHIAPGSFLLTSEPPSILPLPEITIDISDRPSFDSPMFELHITLPPTGTPLGCTFMTCTYNNLPYLYQYHPGSSIATSLSKYGPHNSTFWVLSINHREFSTAAALATHIASLQQPSISISTLFILAKRKPTDRTSFANSRAIFNQIRLSYKKPLPSTTTPAPVIIPAGYKIIIHPTRPTAPDHIGQLSDNPLASYWKDAIFENYTKMQRTGTWSAPILRTSVPSTKSILHPRISFRVKDTESPNTYELQGCTCADGTKQRQFIDFTDSYSPVGAIDSIRLLLAISAAHRLQLHVLDITNAFQSSIIFDPEERVYINLPPFYLDWFTSQWPDYKLPTTDTKNLVLQCLRSLQGTRDAGRRWYSLLSGHFRELHMTRSHMDHGIFLWSWNNETCYIALETDDVLMASTTREPFLHLKHDLEKLFDLKVKEGSSLRFLNLRIVQSPHGISMDQTQHIKSRILHDYFNDIPTSSIPKIYYPFPLDSSFEQSLYEAPPLVGRDLQMKE